MNILCMTQSNSKRFKSLYNNDTSTTGSDAAITGKTVIVSSLSDKTLGARERKTPTPKQIPRQ